MRASELFALAHGTKCEGTEECHWCAGPCKRTHYHDDSPIRPHVRITSTAMRVANAFVCSGCWLWRRNSVTVRFLRGTLRDRQRAGDHSLWMTDKGWWGIEKLDHPELLNMLLDPPRRFTLALRTEGRNDLHRLSANDHSVLKADTPLAFTINNVPSTYTVYELKEAIKQRSTSGCEPGVRMLLDLLGFPEQPPPILGFKTNEELEAEVKETAAKRGRGRPRTETVPTASDVTRLLRKSG